MTKLYLILSAFLPFLLCACNGGDSGKTKYIFDNAELGLVFVLPDEPNINIRPGRQIVSYNEDDFKFRLIAIKSDSEAGPSALIREEGLSCFPAKDTLINKATWKICHHGDGTRQIKILWRYFNGKGIVMECNYNTNIAGQRKYRNFIQHLEAD